MIGGFRPFLTQVQAILSFSQAVLMTRIHSAEHFLHVIIIALHEIKTSVFEKTKGCFFVRQVVILRSLPNVAIRVEAKVLIGLTHCFDRQHFRHI
jgi:hypothetical protein